MAAARSHMKKSQLYLLALLIAAVGLGAFFYKWKVLGFPVLPVTETEVWEVQARVEFKARTGGNRITLQVPQNPPGYAVLNDNFLARGFKPTEQKTPEAREVIWQARRATGTQVLYYRATVYRDQHKVADEPKPRVPPPPTWDEPFATARATLLEQVRAVTVDSATFAAELVRRLAEEDPTEEVELLLEGNDDDAERAALIVGLLAERRIPARVAWGLPLRETDTSARLQPLLQVYDLESRLWNTVDQHTGANGWPEDTMLWSIGPKPVLAIDRNPRGILEFSVTRSLADSLATAKKRLEVRDRALVAYSLLALPLQTQGTYKILLLVPVGAFIMLLLRNIVGIKTFGTFMPVLIALAFNWTGVVAGVILFVIVISLGLLVRFYMERLKLLLVPRLTAVLIVVVLLMALVSVVSNKLGFEIGLNVALFPMIIMTMTIERVSVAWEERSPGFAIRQALGSLVIASLAYIVMGETHMQHIVFVFPELLLVLLALTLVLGRYSGYRLTELFRFRALAREKPANEGQGG